MKSLYEEEKSLNFSISEKLTNVEKININKKNFQNSQYQKKLSLFGRYDSLMAFDATVLCPGAT